MRVDRTRFLFLTAALAADGCNSPPPATPLVGLVEVPSTAPPAPAELPDASLPSAPDASSGAAAAPDAALAPSREGSAPQLPDDSCAATNAQGTPADCTKLTAGPGPQCESFYDTQSECEDMRRLFKPAVAEKATRCLAMRSGTRGICQFGVAGVCASQAFRASCGDPSTLKECTDIVRRCAKIPTSSAVPRLTAQECQGALSAVAPEHRASMLSCMNEGCTAGYCFSYLR